MMTASCVPFTLAMYYEVRDYDKETINAIVTSLQDYAKQLAEEDRKIKIRTREIAEEQKIILFRLKEHKESDQEHKESVQDHSKYFAEREKWNKFIDLYFAELEACHTIYRLDCLNAPKKLFDNRYNDWEAYNRDWNLSDQERREHDDELYVLYRAKRANLECLIDWGVKNRDIGNTFPY